MDLKGKGWKMTFTSAKEVSKFSPMDVVSNVLVRSKVEEVPSDRKFLQTFFMTMKEQDNVSSLLEDFAFSEADIYPFSRELESLLTLLQLGGVIIMENPKFSKFRVNQKVREKILRKASGKFDERQQELLDELGQEFKKAVNTFQQTVQ